ncbi:GntR family transcriptional regulator [Vibrio mimicus]
MVQRTKLKQPRYVFIKEVIEHAIIGGRLKPGQLLLEQPLSKLFKTSRVPVKNALELLDEQGVVTKNEGRGYIVSGPSGLQVSPIRTPVSEDIFVNDDEDLAYDSRPSAEKIFSQVESAIANCIVFGHFRIIETELVKNFCVSNTVTRQVLLKLKDTGLVDKAQNSHWVAGPLTSQSVVEDYELRILLEPAALVDAARYVPRSFLESMNNKLEQLINKDRLLWIEDIESVEQDLHVHLLSYSKNQKILRVLSQSRMPLIANINFYQVFGVEEGRNLLKEHKLVIAHLLNGLPEAAGVSLKAHLILAKERTKQRLKSLAVCSEPDLPSFLQRVI